MRSRLTPDHYLSAEIFALEQERIFRRVWIFAAFKKALAAPNAYVTREIGGVPVLVQNIDGEIRAFENLCPHRQLPVQLAPFGQAPMRCAYHGWTFKPDGSVRVIPTEKSLYGYDEKTRNELCLKRFAVAEIGQLVFVCLADEPPPLEAQFTPEYQQRLADFSNHLSDVGLHVNLKSEYNWKLNHENIMDFNHIPYIHPKTFLPILPGFQKLIREDKPMLPEKIIDHWQKEQINLAACSRFYSGRMDSGEPYWKDRVDIYNKGKDTFSTFIIWPNVNFYTDHGYFFALQQFHPISPAETQFRLTQFIARTKQGEEFRGIPAILRGQIKNEVFIINEDRVFLNALQANLHHQGPSANQGQYEKDLIENAKVYLRMLAGEQPW